MKSFLVVLAIAAVSALGHVEATETTSLRRVIEPAPVPQATTAEGGHANITINGIRGKWCDRWPFYCNYRQLKDTEPAAVPQATGTGSHVNATTEGIRGKWCDRWPFYCNYRQLKDTEPATVPQATGTGSHVNATTEGIRGKWCDRWPFYCNY